MLLRPFRTIRDTLRGRSGRPSAPATGAVAAPRPANAKQGTRSPASRPDRTPAGPSHPLLDILNNGYGFERSRAERMPVDSKGQPLPWYTYPAIEYIRQLDLSDKRVFEYGGGSSSRFWAGIAQSVVTVEKNKAWHDSIRASIPANVNLLWVPDNPAYERSILAFEPFDVIVIDGSERYQCAGCAIERLKPGGLIILDNSDWYVKAAGRLRAFGLLQVDMTGFGPINCYTWTTSFFFHRDFSFRPRGATQPAHGTGSLRQYAAEEADIEV